MIKNKIIAMTLTATMAFTAMPTIGLAADETPAPTSTSAIIEQAIETETAMPTEQAISTETATPPEQTELSTQNDPTEIYEELKSALSSTDMFGGDKALFSNTSGTLVPSDEFGLINFKYSTLISNMEQAGYGETATMDTPELSDGYASSLSALFTNTFGNINSSGVKEATLPEGLNVSSMLSTMSSERTKLAKKDYKNDEVFKTVNNAISIGDVFKSVKSGVKQPSTASTSDLSKMLKSASSSIKADAAKQKSSAFSAIKSEQAANEQAQQREGWSIDTEAETTFNSYVVGTKAKLNLEKDKMKAAKEETAEEQEDNESKIKDILAGMGVPGADSGKGEGSLYVDAAGKQHFITDDAKAIQDGDKTDDDVKVGTFVDKNGNSYTYTKPAYCNIVP